MFAANVLKFKLFRENIPNEVALFFYWINFFIAKPRPLARTVFGDITLTLDYAEGEKQNAIETVKR
jgi:hypothetical protein